MPVIKAQHILLPKKFIDYNKWSVIASDLYLKGYWNKIKEYINGKPSSLDLILPEAFMSNDNSQIIDDIHAKMKQFNDFNFFEDFGPGMVLVERKIGNKKRLGIVLNVDLEQFSLKKEDNALIRPTEGTTLERILPRLDVRKDAIFELSHTILLYDDRELNIAKDLYNNRDCLQKLYDFDLNENGGHITGWFIRKYQEVINKFNSLISSEYLQKYFNTNIPLMFVVGDGNHSLATAKEYWNRLKVNLTEEERVVHPARYALVEAINIHDICIDFGPIYRFIEKPPRSFLRRLKRLHRVNTKKTDKNLYLVEKAFYKGKSFEYCLPNNSPTAISLVQDLIDRCLEKEIEMSVEYVSSLEELKEKCAKNDKAIGLTLPKIDKNQLFEFIIKHGILPRKSYTLCSDNERRYYLEAHKIKMV